MESLPLLLDRSHAALWVADETLLSRVTSNDPGPAFRERLAKRVFTRLGQVADMIITHTRGGVGGRSCRVVCAQR